MTFGSCLYSLILMPLQLLFEVVYSYAYTLVRNPGVAIIALSLAINFLVLPLYMRADAMQEEQRNTEAKLHNGIAHIRKTFSGDERTMMLQTYYRQNNYSPVSALRGATSLLLEIPFFIAAYRFLSRLSLLRGVSFGPIADLSKPDAMLVIGGLAINLLPILMTVINIISSAIFSKDYPLKTKIQLYSMSAVFLVLLYRSPSGLVFYWTLNNAFSLIKTIFYKLKNPRKVLKILSCAVGVCLIALVCSNPASVGRKYKIVLAMAGVLLCVPCALGLLKARAKVSIPKLQIESTPDKKIFAVGVVFLAILTGILIPSAVIKASPQEFADVNNFIHPIWYIVSSALIAIGTFAIWCSVFYWLASSKIKVVLEYCVCIACGAAIANYLFFGTNSGNISSNLIYDHNLIVPSKTALINICVLCAVACILIICLKKHKNIVNRILAISAAALCCMAIVNIFSIKSSIAEVDVEGLSADNNAPTVTISKTGNNVVVIMLDRAMGEYMPYIFNEKPELKEQFGGFTYYSNVISFGGHTNLAAPALFGGYEYSPVEINKRNTESLASKHDEALKVMPVIFSNEGYDVAVFDPPYAGYQWTPDLSIYDDYPDIDAYILKEAFTKDEIKQQQIKNRYRNFFCFGVVKVSPLFIQDTLYNSGRYRAPNTDYGDQIALSSSTAHGIGTQFDNSYSVLEKLPDMTQISTASGNSFTMMNNETPHEATLLQEPGYEESIVVDNTEYDADNSGRFTLNGQTLRVESIWEYGAYQATMATMIKLGEWFDYLRSNGVYDNTRIILVADHGFGLQQIESFILDDTVNNDDVDERFGDAEFYYPLLMVKDFGETEFSTSTDFMTNADVPTLATEGIINNPTNPFTGKPINSNEKTAHSQMIIASGEHDIYTNNGNQFISARWYSVHDDIWNKDNWSLVAEDAVLDEYP